MKTKVLVTGATGFVGNYVIKELLKRDVEIVASSLSPEKAKAFAWYHKVKYKPLDLSQIDPRADYFQYFEQPHKLIHLAWEGLPNYKDDFHVKINLPTHERFLTNLILNGLSDITVTGTCLEYGLHEGCLSEKLLPDPSTSYGQAKNLLRQRLEAFQKNHPYILKWVRLFYMYGQGQNPNSLLSQLDRAIQNKDAEFNMSGGEQERDYLPIEKVADYLVSICMQETAEGIINCCSGVPIKIIKLVQDYLAGKNAKLHINLGYYPYTDYEPMRFWGDTKKLRDIVG